MSTNDEDSSLLGRLSRYAQVGTSVGELAIAPGGLKGPIMSAPRDPKRQSPNMQAELH